MENILHIRDKRSGILYHLVLEEVYLECMELIGAEKIRWYERVLRCHVRGKVRGMNGVHSILLYHYMRSRNSDYLLDRLWDEICLRHGDVGESLLLELDNEIDTVDRFSYSELFRERDGDYSSNLVDFLYNCRVGHRNMNNGSEIERMIVDKLRGYRIDKGRVEKLSNRERTWWGIMGSRLVKGYRKLLAVRSEMRRSNIITRYVGDSRMTIDIYGKYVLEYDKIGEDRARLVDKSRDYEYLDEFKAYCRGLHLGYKYNEAMDKLIENELLNIGIDEETLLMVDHLRGEWFRENRDNLAEMYDNFVLGKEDDKKNKYF